MSGFIVDIASALTIIDGMKGLNCSPLFGSHGGLKKSLYTTQGKDGFIGPVTSFSSSRQYSFLRKVAGYDLYITAHRFAGEPATVFLLALFERT